MASNNNRPHNGSSGPNPHGPFSWGKGPGSGKRLPKNAGGDGCAVAAVAMLGSALTVIGGITYGIVQVLG